MGLGGGLGLTILFGVVGGLGGGFGLTILFGVVGGLGGGFGLTILFGVVGGLGGGFGLTILFGVVGGLGGGFGLTILFGVVDGEICVILLLPSCLEASSELNDEQPEQNVIIIIMTRIAYPDMSRSLFLVTIISLLFLPSDCKNYIK